MKNNSQFVETLNAVDRRMQKARKQSDLSPTFMLSWGEVQPRIFSINHNLIYRQQDSGKCEYHIATPKSSAGIREIPMLNEVRRALLEERLWQMGHGGLNQTEIDGYLGVRFSQPFRFRAEPPCRQQGH